MARLWSCGFELQSVTSGIEWDTTTGSPTIDTTTKRSGAASLRCNPSSATAYITHRVDAASAINDLKARIYLYIATMPSALTEILVLNSTAVPGDIYGIRLNSNGTLELWDEYNNQQIGSDSPALSTGQWYRIEIKVDDNTSATQVWAYLDGTQFASTTSAQGYAWLDTVKIGVVSSGTCDLYFDDIAVNDGNNGSQTDLPGPGSIVHLKPNAAGDNNPTTGSYADVDEVTPNDATDYIELDSAGNIGDFNIEAWPGQSGDTITLVQVGYRERAESAASESKVMRLKSQSGGTLIEGVTQTHNDTTWRTNGDLQPRVFCLTSYTDPQGSGPWTPSLLGTAQIGVRAIDATPHIHVSTLWAMVEYVPASGETINLAASIAGTSNTPDAAAAMVRSLIAAIARSSLTPDAAASVARNIEAAIAGSGVTPDVAASVTRAVLANIVATTAAPDIAIVIARALAAAINSVSLTPDIAITIARALSASIAAESQLPDITITLEGLISLIANIAGSTLTPDVSASVVRSLIATIAPESATADAVATVTRNLIADIAASSFLPDIAITLEGLINLSAAISGVSVTPDLSATIARNLTSLISAESVTPEAQASVARELVAAIEGTSITPDDVIVILSGLGMILDPGIVSVTPKRIYDGVTIDRNYLSATIARIAEGVTPERVFGSATPVRTIDAA